MSLDTPGKNQYRYRLDGFDDGWHEGVGVALAQYTNVPPGDYTFRVMGSNNDGLWSEDGDMVHISFSAFFYNTWWFSTCFGILIFGSLLTAFRYRSKLGREEAANLMRQNIAMDLHDDLGSRIATLALSIELADKAQTDENLVGPSMSSLLLRARRLSHDFRDSIWVIHSEEDHVADLIQQMQTSAERSIVDVDYTFNVTGDELNSSIDMGVRRHIYLMFKEIVHNAVKHSNSESIEILVDFRRPIFRFEVRDHGDGFDLNQAESGYGLANLKRRSHEIGAELTIASVPESGTIVSLEVALS